MAKKRNRWDSDSDDDGDVRAHAYAQRQRTRSPSRPDALTETQLCSTAEASLDPAATTSNTSNTSDTQHDKPPPEQHNFYLHGCRSVDCYARIGKIDEGTYGVVSKARDKVTGDIVALKQVKMSADVCHEGFPVTALRETNVLLALSHPNIVSVREMVVGSTPDKIFMVMDYAEHDLKSVMEHKLTQPFLQSEVKYLLQSLLRAVAYMHERWYIHRDLKTSNLLYDRDGRLRVCDFGLARKYGSPLRSYTQLVVTLWYRAPELLLGATTYSTAVDMWSVGCIFGELLLLAPLFPGRGELDQLDQIFQVLGAPTAATWPDMDATCPSAQNVRWSKYSKQSKLRDTFPLASAAFASTSRSSRGACALSTTGLDLLARMLAVDPKQRISANDALAHPYFREAPAPATQDAMPTFAS